MAAVDWLEYKCELVVLLKLGWPMTVSVLFYALMYPATLAFCGTLGLLQLDIASLAVSVFQLVVVPIENGLRWSCLTFFSQAMGGSKRNRAGIILQRSLTAAVCLWLVSCGIAINCANLLVIIGQDPEISVGSQEFITILMPGCLAVLIFRVLMAYMDCLQKVYPTLLMHMAGFFICVGLQSLFIFQFELGSRGAAIGLCLALCTLPVMMITYIVCSGVSAGTWPGWSLRSLLQWKEYYHNLFPSILNQLVFVFSSELGTFVAGSLGKSELAVQGIMFQMFIVTMQPCVGAGSAAISRIGNYMGAGRYLKGKMVYRLILILLGTIGIIEALILFAMKDVLPTIFSADAETKELFGKIIYFVIPYTVFVSSAWGNIAALRGCNYHNLCVIVGVIAIWVIGHPIGLTLTFAVGWGMFGLWTGYAVSSFFWNLIGFFFAGRLRWHEISQQVSGEAEQETDIDGFITHDETRPLLKPKLPKSGKHKESQQLLTAEADCQSGRKISVKRILRTKLVPFVVLVGYCAAAVTLRVVLPIPQFHTNSNSSFVANSSLALL